MGPYTIVIVAPGGEHGEDTFIRASLNTVLLVVVASVVTILLSCLLSCLVSWFAVRTRTATGKALDALAFASVAIPPIVMAVAVLLFSIVTPIYGTIWAIALGHIIIDLSFGTRAMNGAFIQIHNELEDAATISGAGWVTSLRKVVLPIVWPHIINAWLWVVAHSARDLTFPLILMTSSNMVLSSLIFLTWGYPDLPAASALSMIMVAGLMALVIPVQILAFRKRDEG